MFIVVNVRKYYDYGGHHAKDESRDQGSRKEGEGETYVERVVLPVSGREYLEIWVSTSSRRED